MAGKSAEAFRTISEVSKIVGVPQHVLRFWETKFTAVKPMKRSGNRRYYRPEDVKLLLAINVLLYTDGYTIKGVQKLLREKGVKALIARESADAPPAIDAPAESAPADPPARPAATLFEAALATPAKPDPAFLSSLRTLRDQLADAIEGARMN